MTDITNILYWISTGLLIPVIVVLLIYFIRSLIIAGGYVGSYINRLNFMKQLAVFEEELKQGNFPDKNANIKLKGNQLFNHHLNKIIKEGHNELVGEKLLADFEIVCEKDLSSAKSLARLGPMLGLMGTLIPMGPALVGLAAGDISSMAQNMQVAFSTTVVGLLVGAIGYLIQLVKQRWFVEDMNNLEFIYQYLLKNNTPLNTIKYEKKETVS